MFCTSDALFLRPSTMPNTQPLARGCWADSPSAARTAGQASSNKKCWAHVLARLKNVLYSVKNALMYTIQCIKRHSIHYNCAKTWSLARGGWADSSSAARTAGQASSNKKRWAQVSFCGRQRRPERHHEFINAFVGKHLLQGRMQCIGSWS